MTSRGPDSADTPVPITVPPTPTTGPALTRFRLRGDCVLDFPLHTSFQGGQLAATVWPDARQPTGWGRQFWDVGPEGRGFIAPMTDLGDVIQFSAQHAPAAFTQWHGYLHAITRDSLIIHGSYPSAYAAYAAAQLALVQQIHAEPAPPPDPRVPTASIHLPSPSAPAGGTIAQPPASVSVTFNGPQATVGDPRHGWLVVNTAPLLAAMARPSEELHDLLQDHLPGLDGLEAPVVLAALAAYYRPGDLSLPTTRPEPPTPEPPDTAEPSGPDPAPEGPTPPEPDQPEPGPAADNPAADHPGPSGPAPSGPTEATTPAAPNPDPPTPSIPDGIL